MDESLPVGILTIGTEVVSGQIVNSNTAWIANELTNLRLNPKWHMTVADLKVDMLQALDYLKTQVKIIIVTGGLGPTSDDFTRDIIAEWAQRPLEFDPPSWVHIEERFSHLGIKPPESNRQQCYFPRGAQILFNRKGTAHGFRIEAQQTLCFVLPGPPEEIKAIWHDHIAAELSSKAAHTDALVLKRWQCLGVSESQVGELVEDIIKDTSLLAGYRPHLPYIEIKIWCKQSLLSKESHVLDKLDAALDRYTVVRDDDDVLTRLFENLKDFDDIHVDDKASLGAISQRIGLNWSRSSPVFLNVTETFSPENNIHDIRGPNTISLSIGPLREDGSWDIWFKTGSVSKLQTLKLPYKRNPERASRERLFICEQSLAAFARMAEKGFLTL